MANKRLISRGLSSSRKVGKLLGANDILAEFALCLFCFGIPWHDDQGQVTSDPMYWKSNIFPIAPNTLEEFEKGLILLMGVDMLRLSDDGNTLEYIGHEKIQNYRTHRMFNKVYVGGVVDSGIKDYPSKVIVGGYWMLLTSENKIHMSEHRYVVSQHIGRGLGSEEIIHHKDENKLNNSIENLIIMGREGHLALHRKAWKRKGNITRKEKSSG